MDNESFQPLFSSGERRFVLFPLHDKTIWSLYKQSLAAFWTAEQLTSKIEWKVQDTPTSLRLAKFIAAFSIARGPNSSFQSMLCSLAQAMELAEARSFIGYQVMISNIHSESSHDICAALLPDHYLRASAFLHVEQSKYHHAREEWIKSRFCPQQCIVTSILTCLLTTTVAFSGVFCQIEMDGRCQTELQSWAGKCAGDMERLADFFIHILPLAGPLPSNALAIVRELADVELAFVKEVYGQAVECPEGHRILAHVQQVTDTLVQRLGYPPIFGEHRTGNWIIPSSTVPIAGDSSVARGQDNFTTDEEF